MTRNSHRAGAWDDRVEIKTRRRFASNTNLASNRIPVAMAASTTTKTQRVQPEPGFISRQIHVMQKVIAKKATLPKEPDLLNRYWS